MLFFYILLIFSIQLLPYSLKAQQFPDKQGYFVNDFAKILSHQEKNTLEGYLRKVENETGNEIVVAIFTDLQGYDIETFSIQLARKWKIGKSDKQNGVLILLDMQSHKIRYEVGYGLEGVLTDITTHTISQKFIIPNFRQQAYFKGLYEGVQQIAFYASKEFSDSQGNKKTKSKGSFLGKFLFFLGLLLIPFGYLIFQARKFTRRKKNDRDDWNDHDRGNGGGGFFVFPWFGGGGYGGGYHDSSDSSGSSDSFGDFGDFGGGDFGGGGSSDSW